MMMMLLLCNITALLCNRLTKTCKLGSQHATLIWDIQVIVNWHLSKHFICWPVSHDYIAGSDLELIKIMFFFKWTTAATTRHCHTWNTLETRDAYHILTMKSKEDGWAARKAQWEQSNSKKHTEWFDTRSRAVKSSCPCINPPATPYSLWRRLLASSLVLHLT